MFRFKTDWFTPTRKMNADDVVFTFQRIFDRNNPWHNVNGSNFPYFDSLQFADNVKSVRKLDNHTVEFRLAQPDASFVAPATHYASVMSAEYARKLEKKIVRNNSTVSRSALDRISCRNTAPGNIFAYNVMMISGVVSR